MKFKSTNIEGLFILENLSFKDQRGIFIKNFNFDFFNKNELSFYPKEFYYSLNKKNVIRGMHFQSPPNDHNKLVNVSKGSVIDVVLDIRKNSNTYGEFFSIKLNSINSQSVFIPKGCAHGFVSLEDDSLINYIQDSVYNNVSDSGIKFNSFGFNWKVKKPITSERDRNFINFNNFNSPF